MKMQNPVHSGEILKVEFLEPLSISAEKLAEKLLVTTDEAHALLECRISLTEKMAVKLQKMFGTSSEFWMNLQKSYDDYQLRLEKALANSGEAQFQLIADAYNDGDEAVIDAALTRVAMVRRMKTKGIFDMLESEPDANAKTASRSK